MVILPKKAVQKMQAYDAPAENRRQHVKLDMNENTELLAGSVSPLPPSWIHTYPEYDEYTARLAESLGLQASQVILTNGSDEALWILAQTFIEPQLDYAVVNKPTFSVIVSSLQIAGANITQVPVKPDLSFDIKAIERALILGPKMAIFASPDNPTGGLLEPAQVSKWCKRFKDTLFVVDEAYAEYSGVSYISLLQKHSNLLITRTLSKAWGLAGLRLGAIFGDPQLLEYLKRVRLPYSVNAAAVWMAQRMLDRKDEVLAAARATMDRKDYLIASLEERGYSVTAGAGNFFLLGVGLNAHAFTEFLRARGILVRNRSEGHRPGESALWGQVRVSIGTDKENEKFLKAVDDFNLSYGVAFDLDGTLVDTTKSFDKAIEQLVHKYTGDKLSPKELVDLRLQGGFNDCWDACVELLRRRGVITTRAELEPEAFEVYVKLARVHEKLLIDLQLLERLRMRHPLFIVTGRARYEYEPLWGETFNSLCARVYCMHDLKGKAPKPAPDYLQAVKKDFKLRQGIYIGNSIDDMWSARDAGFGRIAVTTTLPAEKLKEAGAEYAFAGPDSIKEVFLLL